MMMDKTAYKVLLSGFSPWLIIGAVLVLLPIVAMMTLADVHRQKQQSIRLMMEKGAALIRSFEAGTRMGMRGGHGRGFQLQRLLTETAAQADIAHLIVVGINGSVIAHNRTDQVGSRYGDDLDLGAVYQNPDLAWRRSGAGEGASVFEIFGKFAPLAGPPRRPMHRHMMVSPPMGPQPGEVPPMVIFVGLRTDAVDAARAADARHTIVMAAVLLLVGCTGVLLLFLVHNYRTARISLMRVQAFSDNLVSRIPIGLVAVDRNGRVTAVNAAAEATLGVTDRWCKKKFFVRLPATTASPWM
jgi:two-component system sensor histidine kinase HydH